MAWHHELKVEIDLKMMMKGSYLGLMNINQEQIEKIKV
jgi:hypothetical protein